MTKKVESFAVYTPTNAPQKKKKKMKNEKINLIEFPSVYEKEILYKRRQDPQI